MKTVKPYGELKTSLASGLLLAVGTLLLCVPVESLAINAVVSGTAEASQDASPQPGAPAPRYSAGVADVLRMAEAKIDPEVIKAYVKSSPTPFNLSATEIIALKDRGISSEILTAMIQRGSELRSQALQNVPPAPNPAAPPPYPATANPYAPAPAYDYSAQGAYPGYAYSYPAYSYSYPDYSSVWPSYYGGYLGCGLYGGFGCGYSWPYCWPSAYWGGWPYRGYCGYRYPGYWGGRGYGYGYGYNHGNRGYYNAAYRSGAYRSGYYGNGGHAVAYRSGFYGNGGHAAAYGGRGGGFPSGGGVAHSASFGGHGGGFSGHAGGGSGGHAGGRGR